LLFDILRLVRWGLISLLASGIALAEYGRVPKAKIMAKTIPTLSAASRKAVDSILSQQGAAKSWTGKAHAFGIAKLAEYCGIGENPPQGDMDEAAYYKAIEANVKAARAEFAKELIENGWLYASNLKKVLEAMELIPSKAESLEEYNN
jgi:hypothetical protein